jgi:hypothetical protein
MKEVTMALSLALTLLSDTTFGRGDGVAGLVDAEVEHDPRTGLPRLNGRTLKGLLVEECANLLFALDQARPTATESFAKAAAFLFGAPGSDVGAAGALHVGPAELPADLRAAVQGEIDAQRLRPDQVLDSLTAIRRQTAMTRTGVPDTGSLRASRVVLRETMFSAPLDFLAPPDPTALALLAGCALSLRRLGTARNRGRGRVRARLWEDLRDVTDDHSAPLRDVLAMSIGGKA